MGLCAAWITRCDDRGVLDETPKGKVEEGVPGFLHQVGGSVCLAQSKSDSGCDERVFGKNRCKRGTDERI